MASVFPPDDEIDRYAVVPGSITWLRASDTRGFFGAGTALLLQVAHPTVGAGVAEHSDFEADPWGRLLRTVDYVNLTVYGGPERAALTGRRMRAMHQKIKGVKPDGERYHALEPEAFAWVHATLADTIVAVHNRFATPFSVAERESFYRQWRDLGRLLGIRERDLPETWREFDAYCEDMIDRRLEDNETVRTVLKSLTNPAAPPLPFLTDGAWRVLSAPASRAVRLATVGLLRPSLREKLDLDLSRAEWREFRALGRMSRSLTPVLPKGIVVSGPRYLRWREEQIQRGQMGAGTPDGRSLRSPALAA